MDNRNRRIFSLLLGSLLGASIGWGLSGGWNRLSLMSIPFKQEPGDLIGLGIGGALGLCWGYLVTWPKRWWIGMLTGGIGGSAAMVALSVGRAAFEWVLVNGHKSEWESPGYFSRSVHAGTALALLAFLPGTVTALAQLGLLKAICSASRLKSKLGYPMLLLCALALIILGAALTTPLYLISDRTFVEALKTAHTYAQARGWRDYTLELVRADSGYATIRIQLPDGQTHTCDGWVYGNGFYEP